jgi:hypothetical protein
MKQRHLARAEQSGQETGKANQKSKDADGKRQNLNLLAVTVLISCV